MGNRKNSRYYKTSKKHKGGFYKRREVNLRPKFKPGLSNEHFAEVDGTNYEENLTITQIDVVGENYEDVKIKIEPDDTGWDSIEAVDTDVDDSFNCSDELITVNIKCEEDVKVKREEIEDDTNIACDEVLGSSLNSFNSAGSSKSFEDPNELVKFERKLSCNEIIISDPYEDTKEQDVQNSKSMVEFERELNCNEVVIIDSDEDTKDFKDTKNIDLSSLLQSNSRFIPNKPQELSTNRAATNIGQVAIDSVQPFSILRSLFISKNVQKKSTYRTVPEKVEAPLTCNYCELGFSDKKLFNLHLNTHTGAIPYCCSLCEKKFFKETQLKKHFKKHPEESPKSVCGYCARSFAYTGFLRQHLSTHSHSVLYNCHECDRDFRTKKSIKTHIIKAHSGNTPAHVCQYCKKAFQYNCHLKIHLRSHTGEKPYKCSLCAESFSIATKLKVHYFSAHSSENRYTCAHCNKGFSNSSAFSAHMKFHLKENNVVCGRCGKTFRTHMYLKEHAIKVHGDKTEMLECCHCGKLYPLKSDLSSHIKTHFRKVRPRYPCNVFHVGDVFINQVA